MVMSCSFLLSLHLRGYELYKVVLTKTLPPGIDGVWGGVSVRQTVTYIAGEDCMQRLVLYHGLYHFRNRMQACMLRKLKQQQHYNQTDSLKELILGAVQREKFMRFLIWVYKKIKT
jgi:hypothetical protein